MKTGTLVIILGPTAVGKTEIALALARSLSTEILSVDSRQFYKEITIGTAAPSTEQILSVKHHFTGHLSVTEPYNISRYEAEAISLLEDLFKKHDTLIMVGGSGLYIDAVVNGIDDLPETDPKIREKLSREYKEHGISYLADHLQKLDPEYFQKVDQKNPVRLQRALEICLTTGRPYSSFLTREKKKRSFNVIKVGLNIPRNELLSRIDARVDEMISSGLIEEAKRWIMYRDYNALRTVGYTELFRFFDGDIDLDEAVRQIKINTRRYAKRQMTWFRKDQSVKWFSPADFGKIQDYILSQTSL